MTPEKEILDTSLEGIAHKSDNHDLMNRLDYGFNLFLLAIACLLGLASLIENDLLIYLGLWNLGLGLYQLISAIVGSLRGNAHKRRYLIVAITYLILLWLGGSTGLSNSFPENLEPIFLVFFIIVLPLIGAAYYTYLCYEAKNSRS